MRVEPFEPAHFRDLVLQPHQAAYQAMLTSTDWEHLGQVGEAWTGLDGDTVIACAGLLDLGGGRAQAWALLSGTAGRHMTALTRAVRRGLELSPYRFLQAHTAADFAPAARWATMAGFASVARLPRYCDNGEDAVLWIRTR